VNKHSAALGPRFAQSKRTSAATKRTESLGHTKTRRTRIVARWEADCDRVRPNEAFGELDECKEHGMAGKQELPPMLDLAMVAPNAQVRRFRKSLAQLKTHETLRRAAIAA